MAGGALFLARGLCRLRPRAARGRRAPEPARRPGGGVPGRAPQRRFLGLFLAAGCANLGFYLASPITWYLNYYYVYGGKGPAAATTQAWLGTASQCAALISLPAYRAVAQRGGKTRAFQAAIGMHLVTSVANYSSSFPAIPGCNSWSTRETERPSRGS